MRNKRHRGVRLLDLGGGRWVARFKDRNKMKQVDLVPLGLTNENLRVRWAIAKAGALAKVKAQIEATGAESVDVTIEKAVADYLALFGNRNTTSAKASPLAGMVEFMQGRGAKDVQDITGPMLAAWGDHVRRPKNEHKTQTRNWWLACTGAWARWCGRNGWLPRCTGDQIKAAVKRQRVERDPVAILPPDAIVALLRSCIAHDEAHDEQVAAFVLFCLLAGLRYSEAAGLTWAECDLSARCVRLASGRSKNKVARTVTLTECPSAVELLGALRLRSGGKGRVFPSVERARAELLRGRTMRKPFNAPFWTWHMLRRTCGSMLVCSGILGAAGVWLTAKRSGHSVQVAERHYLGALTDLPKNAATIEAAGGFEAEARAIVARVAGVQTQAVAQ